VLNDFRETDKFGIPIDMFGYVPEIFCKMFGRVTKLAALIDIRMPELLHALDDNPQPTFSGRYGAQLEGLVREAAASLDSDELKADIARDTGKPSACVNGETTSSTAFGPIRPRRKPSPGFRLHPQDRGSRRPNPLLPAGPRLRP
jgi:hypothetical protein